MCKQIYFFTMLSIFCYAQNISVVKFIKENNSSCKIINNKVFKTNCSKKKYYLLDVGDRVFCKNISKHDFIFLKKDDFIFVKKIKNGYEIERSFISYLDFIYNNFKHPSKNIHEGGIFGIKNKNISSLPSYTKIHMGQKIIIPLKDFPKNIKYEIEDNFGKVLKLPKISNNNLIIDSKKMSKDKHYKLYIWNENINKTIDIEFLKGRDEQIFKKFLKLNQKDKNKYRKSLFNELQIKIKGDL